MPARFSPKWSFLSALLALVVIFAGASLAFAQGSPPVVFVNINRLNQRTGPGVEYAIQGSHPGGAMLAVVGRTADRSWWEVESQFGIGWVNNEHVLTRGNFSGVPVVTVFGVLGRPDAMVPGLSIPVYTLPNAASRVIGEALSEARFPILAQTRHISADTWYWLIETREGNAWVQQSAVAVVGDAGTVPILDHEQAMTMASTAVSGNGVIHPPDPAPIPSAPTAPPVVQPVFVPTAIPGAAGGAAAAPAAPPANDTLRITGDCSALPLVNFLLQHSPVSGTGLDCTDSSVGRDLVILGQADLSMTYGSICAPAAQVSVATLVDGSGAGRELNFCVGGTPNARTQAFINWVESAQGDAAIRLYRGLPNDSVPVSATPR